MLLLCLQFIYEVVYPKYIPMKRLPNTKEIELDPTVQRIWEDIVYSMDQYTHDSTLSKFYLPEDILSHCRKAANIFAQLLYAPIPSAEEVRKTRLYGLIYLSMTCGVQLYLKERALTKPYAPYHIKTNSQDIRIARTLVSRMLSEGVKVQNPVSQVMELILSNLQIDQYIRRLTLKGREFNAEKFETLLPAAIMWGYLFAKELVIDEI